jgi:hypothetical protein
VRRNIRCRRTHAAAAAFTLATHDFTIPLNHKGFADVTYGRTRAEATQLGAEHHT